MKIRKLKDILRLKVFNERIDIPMRLVLLMTVPRSGSTWLFDALRCHPGIYLCKRAVISSYFNFNGRRYPRDLSNTKDSSLIIEMQPGRWESIRTYNLKDVKRFADDEMLNKNYAIEKFHPHFFRFNSNNFSHRLEKLAPSKIRMIYLLREPESAILSFLKYQQREPTWMSNVKQEILPEYMFKTYKNIFQMTMKQPGLIVEYKNLLNNFTSTYKMVLDYLWPGQYEDREKKLDELCAFVQELTSREKTIKVAKSFLSKTLGPTGGYNGDFLNFFKKYEILINECKHYYNLITQQHIHHMIPH